jgi:uncharacterized DUF497 family protein
VDIEFDVAKDASNLAKHGISLADAADFELATAVVVIEDRAEHGETRYRAFGRVEGEARCLVFTYRGSVIRVISYRRVHEKEMRRYGA